MLSHAQLLQVLHYIADHAAAAASGSAAAAPSQQLQQLEQLQQLQQQQQQQQQQLLQQYMTPTYAVNTAAENMQLPNTTGKPKRTRCHNIATAVDASAARCCVSPLLNAACLHNHTSVHTH
jgi:hypothetical protein